MKEIEQFEPSEDKYQITVNDWIDHIRFEIDLLYTSSRHAGNLLVPISTLFIISLFALITAILNTQAIIFILSLIGLCIAEYYISMLFWLNIKNYEIIDELMVLLRSILSAKKIDTETIHHNYNEICKIKPSTKGTKDKDAITIQNH